MSATAVSVDAESLPRPPRSAEVSSTDLSITVRWSEWPQWNRVSALCRRLGDGRLAAVETVTRVQLRQRGETTSETDNAVTADDLPAWVPRALPDDVALLGRVVRR